MSGTPTVVSGPNSDGVNWRSTAMFLGAANGVPNNPPMAAFTSSCQNLTCGFNGTSSTDTDGSIASYAWAFGDSTTGSGATPAHAYGAAGTYHVTLTVTDDGGRHQQRHAGRHRDRGAHAGVRFIGAGNAGGGSANTRTVTVPASAAAGDTALLFLTAPTNSGWSAPRRDRLVPGRHRTPSGTLITTLWVKTLAAGDAGATVRLTNSELHALGVEPRGVPRRLRHRADRRVRPPGRPELGRLTSPATARRRRGDWAVSIVGDRSGATRTYTAPANVTVRDVSTDSGGLTTQTLIADSNGPLAPGKYGGFITTTDAATSAAAEWTILLRPQS